MKKKFAPQVDQLKDMFPAWTDVDLLFALQEADGDVARTVEKITQGNVYQFAEVKSSKDRARSKAKEPAASASSGATTDKPPGRGTRGRGGLEGTRGGRSRGSERGRGGGRGGRGGQTMTNGSSNDTGSASAPTSEWNTWDDNATTPAAAGTWDDSAPAATNNTTATDSWGTDAATAATASNSWETETAKDTAAISSWATEPAATGSWATEPAATGSWATEPAATSSWGTEPAASAAPAFPKRSIIPEGGPKKTWASMLAPKPAPVPLKKPQVSQAPSAPKPTEAVQSIYNPEAESTPSIQEPNAVTTGPGLGVSPTLDSPDLNLTPPKDPLTEENVEHLPDASRPPPTQTVASTVGSADPRNRTPVPTQPMPIGRPTSTLTPAGYRGGQPLRSASFQRKVLEQEEAVVMPGRNAVDRAAVQFGSMGMNGEPGPDLDEEREDPETRKAPQTSPPSQPRTSLPPAPRQTVSQNTSVPENVPTPKQAPGLPPASQLNQQHTQDANLAPGISNDPTQANQQYSQYARYGQPGMLQDSAIQPQQPQQPQQQQKHYDPFSHQAQPGQYDHFSGQGHYGPQQQQQHNQGGFGGISSAGDNYSQYYTSDQQRSAYNQYYGGSYGPQDVRSQLNQTHQDVAGMGQQRSSSGLGTASNEHGGYGAQAQQQVSIPVSIQDLRVALDKCRNDRERQALVAEIQRLLDGIRSTGHPNAHGPASVSSVNTSSVHGSQTPGKNFRRLAQSSRVAMLLSAANGGARAPFSPVLKTNTGGLPSKQTHSRFPDASNSGHNTPNPPMGGPPHQNIPTSQPGQHNMHAPNHQQQGGYGAGYAYGHPNYNSPYGYAYQNHMGVGQQYGAYAGGYPANKQNNMYGGSAHGYGMGPQSPFEQHSGSPANAAGFGQNQQSSFRGTSSMGSALGSLDEYGRGSAQASGQQQSSGFAAMNDPFARSGSGFGGYGQQQPQSHQQQQQQQQQQHGMPGQEDSLKPFADTTNNNVAPPGGKQPGPSPAFGRPAPAVNNATGQHQQSGLPPPHQQGHQSGFSGYGGFPGSQSYSGLGGLGGAQGQSAYGNYGAGAFGQYGSYPAGSRGGWSQQYGGH